MTVWQWKFSEELQKTKRKTIDGQTSIALTVKERNWRADYYWCMKMKEPSLFVRERNIAYARFGLQYIDTSTSIWATRRFEHPIIMFFLYGGCMESKIENRYKSYFVSWWFRRTRPLTIHAMLIDTQEILRYIVWEKTIWLLIEWKSRWR